MTSNLTPSELARLAEIDAAIKSLRKERVRLMGLDRQRRFRARKGAKD